MTTLTLRQSRIPVPLVVGVSVVAWLVAWFANAPLADWASFTLLGLARGSHLGEAVDFFLADVPKVLLLLLGIATLVTLIRGFFPPRRMRDALAGRGLMAATVGAVAFGDARLESVQAEQVEGNWADGSPSVSGPGTERPGRRARGTRKAQRSGL